MKSILKLMVVFVFTAFFCFCMVTARGWPDAVRWYAWIISIPGFVLMSLFFIQQLLRMRKNRVETPSEEKVSVGKEMTFFGWVVAFVGATWLFGIEVSSLLFVFSYLKLNRGSWLLSISLTALVALIVSGVLSRVLEVSLIEGVVPQWLGF